MSSEIVIKFLVAAVLAGTPFLVWHGWRNFE